MVLIAGGNATAIRSISCDTCELEPFWAAGMRFLLAASIFAVIALSLRTGMPRGRALVGSVLFGALAFAGTFGFAYWGFVRTPAGTGAILLATVPLLTFVFAIAHGQERFRWGGLVGGTLALGGIAVIFGEGVGTGVPLWSLLSLLAGAVCFAEAAIVVKAFPRVHPASMNAIAMAVGGGAMLVLALVFGEDLAVPQQVDTWIAQGYLVILGSVVVFALYLYVLGRWTASAVSYEGVLIPLVTVLLSAWLLDERITLGFAAGATLVLLGVYVGALRQADPEGS